MKKVVVIGAGTMGNGIVHTFAQYGYKVNMVDISQSNLDNAMDKISQNLDRMIAKETITESKKEETLSNISTTTDWLDVISDTDLVVEAATENVDLKLKIFSQLDKNAPKKTILASNTSSISITKIASATERPDKVIGMHFMNPVPIMKLVEVIKGYSTSLEVCNTILEISKSLQKVPVMVNDYPGFVANRILMPMINEAIETLYTGEAGVYEIDTVMKLGMGQPMGPLQLADFIGLDICLSILNVMHDGFKQVKYAPCPLLVNMVQAGKLGVKSGEGFYDYSQSKKAEHVAPQFMK